MPESPDILAPNVGDVGGDSTDEPSALPASNSELRRARPRTGDWDAPWPLPKTLPIHLVGDRERLREMRSPGLSPLRGSEWKLSCAGEARAGGERRREARVKASETCLERLNPWRFAKICLDEGRLRGEWHQACRMSSMKKGWYLYCTSLRVGRPPLNDMAAALSAVWR